jgi:hypothetical protein
MAQKKDPPPPKPVECGQVVNLADIKFNEDDALFDLEELGELKEIGTFNVSTTGLGSTKGNLYAAPMKYNDGDKVVSHTAYLVFFKNNKNEVSVASFEPGTCGTYFDSKVLCVEEGLWGAIAAKKAKDSGMKLKICAPK